MKLEINRKTCAGCMTCVLTCSFKHYGASSPLLSNIRIIGEEARADFTPTVCAQCDERDCINACPVEALSVNPETGAIAVDTDSCILCEVCVEACKHGGIRKVTVPEGTEKIAVCDLCGGEPQCAKYCRQDAVKVAE